MEKTPMDEDLKERHRQRLRGLARRYLDRGIACKMDEECFKLPSYGSDHALAIFMELVGIEVDLDQDALESGMPGPHAPHWHYPDPPVDVLDAMTRKAALCGYSLRWVVPILPDLEASFPEYLPGVQAVDPPEENRGDDGS